MITNTKFHFIKIETWEGNWLIFNPSPQRLQRLIQKHNPKNVYVSVNKWLNYREHNTYQNRMLKQYDLIDIDGQKFNNKEECKSYFDKVNNFLLEHDIHIEERVMTNTTLGGYQLLVSPMPRELLKSEIFKKIDDVFDLKRVRRFPGTYNGNKGSYSYLIDSSGMPYGSSHLADDSGGARNTPTSPDKTKGRQAIRSKLPASFLVKQISNSCFGASNLYVPVLKFKNKPSIKYLSRLQKAYALGDLYLFQCHLDFFAICPKTAQFGRLAKIYRKLGKAGNWKSYCEFTKFRQNFIYTSNIIDLEGMRKLDTFGFINVLEQDANGSYSRPHAAWLKKYYNKSYHNLVGDKCRVNIGRFGQ